MNKVLLIGRLVRDPEANSTNSGIKYTRFTIAVDRPTQDDQTDFIPLVAWRSQAEFVEKYLKKGSLVSVEGRFSSSTYQNAEAQTVTRYEVSVDRVQGLESKAQAELRGASVQSNSNKPLQFEEEKEVTKDITKDVPWELDL